MEKFAVNVPPASDEYIGKTVAGRYKVQVDLQGFASELREGLVFNAGQNGVMNFSLKLSSVQETVTVAGDSPIVQTTSHEVSATIDRQAFENLAVKERHYFPRERAG